MTHDTQPEFEARVIASIDILDPEHEAKFDAAIARARSEVADEAGSWALLVIERDGALDGGRGPGRQGRPDYADVLLLRGPIETMAQAVEVECESNAIDSWLEEAQGVEPGEIGF